MDVLRRIALWMFNHIYLGPFAKTFLDFAINRKGHNIK
jgi:hypothetical protein